MVFYIYKIKDVNYIGSTKNIKVRTQQHRYHHNNKQNWDMLVYQYTREKNINIELEILGVYKKKCSRKIRLLVEQYYINKYNSIKNGLNNCNAFIKNNKNYKKK